MAPCRKVKATLKKESQIPYSLGSSSLSSYVLKVERGEWNYPSYSDCCPICQGEDCAILYASYFRKGLIVEGKLYSVLIVRFLCRRKGNAGPNADRTFSLLPSCLIPYRSSELNLIYKILSFWVLSKKSINESLDFISNLSTTEWYPNGSFLYSLKFLFEESVIKFNSSALFRESYSQSSAYTLESFIKLSVSYEIILPDDSPMIGPTYFGLSYYDREGGWLRNSHFLFGTPYQHRRRS